MKSFTFVIQFLQGGRQVSDNAMKAMQAYCTRNKELTHLLATLPWSQWSDNTINPTTSHGCPIALTLISFQFSCKWRSKSILRDLLHCSVACCMIFRLTTFNKLSINNLLSVWFDVMTTNLLGCNFYVLSPYTHFSCVDSQSSFQLRIRQPGSRIEDHIIYFKSPLSTVATGSRSLCHVSITRNEYRRVSAAQLRRVPGVGQ